MKFARAWYCFSSSCPPSPRLFSYLRERDWQLQHKNCYVYSGRLALGGRLGAPLKSLQRVHVHCTDKTWNPAVRSKLVVFVTA